MSNLISGIVAGIVATVVGGLILYYLIPSQPPSVVVPTPPSVLAPRPQTEAPADPRKELVSLGVPFGPEGVTTHPAATV
jgi:hypothetical protein